MIHRSIFLHRVIIVCIQAFIIRLTFNYESLSANIDLQLRLLSMYLRIGRVFFVGVCKLLAIETQAWP